MRDLDMPSSWGNFDYDEDDLKNTQEYWESLYNIKEPELYDEEEPSEMQRKISEAQRLNSQNNYYKSIHGIVSDGKKSEVELFDEEVEKNKITAFYYCALRLVYYFAGVQYIIDETVDFKVSQFTQDKIETFIKRDDNISMPSIENRAIKTIVGMHEKFNDESVIKSIEKCFDEIRKRLDKAVPFTENNYQHIWGYMQKVIVLTEEIYRYFKVEKLLPQKEYISENTRYIGICRRASRDWYHIDVYFEDIPRQISALGESRYTGSLPDSDQYDFCFPLNMDEEEKRSLNGNYKYWLTEYCVNKEKSPYIFYDNDYVEVYYNKSEPCEVGTAFRAVKKIYCHTF